MEKFPKDDLKIVFCGYRDWSINVYQKLKENFNSIHFHLIKNNKDFKSYDFSNTNLIICAGWSWFIPNRITQNYLVIGTHPSDLPQYAGGSPIQNQVLNNIVNTKNTLFRLRPTLDAGEIIYKNDLKLEGNVSQIFQNFEKSSYCLLEKFINNYPNNPYTPQSGSHNTCKRLKPEQSELTVQKISNMTCKELYNFIRCRTDPYPNAFIKDDTGTLFFNDVKFNPC